MDHKKLIQEVVNEFNKIEHNKKTQFELSFSTKLLHTIYPSLPIFDSNVHGFFKKTNSIIKSKEQDRLLFYYDLVDFSKEFLKKHGKIIREIRKKIYGGLIPQDKPSDCKILDTLLFSIGGDFHQKINFIKRLDESQSLHNYLNSHTISKICFLLNTIDIGASFSFSKTVFSPILSSTCSLS